MDEDEFFMIVSREHIFRDTMDAVERIVFSPKKKIQVSDRYYNYMYLH